MADKITFISVIPTDILADVVSKYEQLSGTMISEGQPEYAICSMVAYAMSLTYNQMNALGNNLLLPTSSGTVLEYIAKLVGIERSSESYATCSVKFKLDSNHQTLTIPQGTRVSTSDGIGVFETIEDISVEAGVVEVTASVVSTAGGSSYNGYAIGSVNVILDPLAYVTSVSNIDVTAGGTDEETDDELRSRVQLAPSSYSCAGAKNAYALYAKKASTQIIDVAIMSKEDDNTIPAGEIDVYSLLEGGELPSQSMCDLIAESLNDEKVRPITDTVRVIIPTAILYSVTIDLKKLPSGDEKIVPYAYKAVKAYLDECALLLGTDVTKSKIIERCMSIAGIYSADVTITSIGTSEVDKLTLTRLPSSAGNIAISLNGVTYLYPVTIGTKEKDILAITSLPKSSGNMNINIGTNVLTIPVQAGQKAQYTLKITHIPTKSGNINITLNGISTSIPVSVGNHATYYIDINSMADAAGTISISIGGHTLTATISGGTQATVIANTITNLNWSTYGYTATVVSNRVTVVKNSSEFDTATATMDVGTTDILYEFTPSYGSSADSILSINNRISQASFDFNVDYNSNTGVFTFTDILAQANLTPIFDPSDTGVTADLSTVVVGIKRDSIQNILTRILNNTLVGFTAVQNGNSIVFSASDIGVVTALNVQDLDNTEIRYTVSQIAIGSGIDTLANIATKIAAMQYEGWTAEAVDNAIMFTDMNKRTCIAPSFLDVDDTNLLGTFEQTIRGVGNIDNGNLIVPKSAVAKFDGMEINITGSNE